MNSQQKTDTKERLANALRANLRRRKEATRKPFKVRSKDQTKSSAKQ